MLMTELNLNHLTTEQRQDLAHELLESLPIEDDDADHAAAVPTPAMKLELQRRLDEDAVNPGTYLIRITAGDGKTAVNPDDPNTPPGPGGGTNVMFKELVPADWNTNSKQQAKVTKEGPNKLVFDIP